VLALTTMAIDDVQVSIDGQQGGVADGGDACDGGEE